MSRKTTVAIAVCAVLLGLSATWGSLYSARSIPVTTAAVIAQALPAQVGALTQAGPPIAGFASVRHPNCHVTVGGTPLAGSYVAYACPAGRGNSQGWQVTLIGANRCIQGVVLIWRDIDANFNTIVWQATAFLDNTCGSIGANVTTPITLVGPDFQGSGSAHFFGDPNYGGGGNITITVAP